MCSLGPSERKDNSARISEGTASTLLCPLESKSEPSYLGPAHTAVWFESGGKALDYVRSDHRFNPESFKDSLEEQGVFVERDALAPLLANMQSLSDEWRDSIGEHGELVFYVDNC
jgi:hypothetical protein